MENQVSSITSVSTQAVPNLYRDRLIGFFGICVLLALTVFLIDRYFDVGQGFIFAGTEKYYRTATFLFPAVFFFGLVILLVRHWENKFLTTIDLAINFLGLGVISFILAVVFPGGGILYPYALFLLLHGVLVPSRTWVQAALGAVSVLSLFFGRIITFQFMSETQRLLLSEHGGRIFWELLLLESVFLIFIALLTVLVTKEINAFRRTCEASRYGSYIIKKYLGTGGMGKVYVASHSAMRRPTALKIMEPKKEDLSTTIARFEREVKLCSTLNHPNTVTIFDYGQCDDHTFYYAMELLDGLDMQKAVEKFGTFPANRLVYILSQVCGSLAEAHAKRIVHRDIKPSNIFIAYIGGIFDFVKVLDFGLAKEIDGKSKDHLTQTNTFLGTPSYTAPEMIFEPDKVDARSDIYMLGCVAYWALTGHPPFEATTDAKILVQHMKTYPKRPSELTKNPIPIVLEKIVMKCLEKDMDRRYQTVSELADALAEVPLDSLWTQETAQAWWNRFLETQQVPTKEEEIVPMKIVQGPFGSDVKISGQLPH